MRRDELPAARDYTAADDATLAVWACARDRAAFDELHRRHHRAVRGYLRARTRNDDQTDEAEQATWIEVWHDVCAYDPARAPFQAFVKNKAKYAALHVRGGRQWREVPIAELMKRYPDLPDDAAAWDLIVKDTGSGRSVPEPPDVGNGGPEPPSAAEFDLVLETTFREPDPPHQYLAFGFVKLLEWKPRRVAAELGALPLSEVEATFEDEYVRESGLPDDTVRTRLAPLRDVMPRRLGEIVHAPRTRSVYAALLGRIAGETTLAEYARSHGDGVPFEHRIVQWWFSTERRVHGRLRAALAGPVEPTRMPPPGPGKRQ
jgi:DNA-directed RNA polymerase specialized sigma24 family protein